MFETNFFTNFSKKKVLLRGPSLTQSGYGVHTRQIARWLLSKDIDLKIQAMPWGNTPWLIDSSLCNGLIGELMQRTVDPTGQRYDATFQVQLPNEWDTSMSNTNIGISAVVETDKCNPSWIQSCNKMSTVIVPSKHCHNVLLQSGKLEVPTQVIPESFPDEILNVKKTKITDLRFETSFNFLLVGQITGKNAENDRKNIFYTIKWICETFKDDKDVGLVIKTNMGRNTKIDRNIVENVIKSVLLEIGKKPSPRIYLLHGEMSDEEISSLYVHPQIKALVSLTRGEGYGLPILEAAASGLPVIATNWSGHLDFMSKGKFIGIDYSLDNVHPSRIDGEIFMPGCKWATPKEDDFKKKVVKFRHASTTPKEWSLELREKIVKEYSFEAVSKIYDETLGKFL